MGVSVGASCEASSLPSHSCTLHYEGLTSSERCLQPPSLPWGSRMQAGFNREAGTVTNCDCCCLCWRHPSMSATPPTLTAACLSLLRDAYIPPAALQQHTCGSQAGHRPPTGWLADWLTDDLAD
jgi:hypothetical protein